MFTGIVEEVGHIAKMERGADSVRVTIHGPTVAKDAHHGDSIAVNGVCLTVTEFDEESFCADVMQVTLDYTAFGALEPNSPVNLERAMSAHGRLGGHIVQGHVDGTAQLLSRTPSENWEIFRFAMEDPALAKYIAKKGSIAINGTSLTVAELSDINDGGCECEVSLIPTTLSDTMLGALEVGDRVNIECDVIAKYVERIHTAGQAPAPQEGNEL